MKYLFRSILVFVALLFIGACTTGKDVVKVIEVTKGGNKGLSKKELAKLEKIKASKKSGINSHELNNVIKDTQSYSVAQYLAVNPNAANLISMDYRVGGYDILDITVYEEEDLSRTGVRICADGTISFPLIGRINLDGLTTSEIGELISNKLARGQFIIDAHVSVIVSGYWSKQFMVLGSVAKPGSFPLKARERVLDAISKSAGIKSKGAGNQLMIIRTQNPNTKHEQKIVIRIDLTAMLRDGDQQSNLLIMDNDLLYIPKARQIFLIGQVKFPGSFYYTNKNITLVEAISMAGGFTKIAARNRTRIVRMENNIEKIIVVKVDAITRSGKKAQDVLLLPGDVIVVPESFF